MLQLLILFFLPSITFASSSEHVNTTLFGFILIFAFAKIFGGLAKMLKTPAVLGELVAGIVLSNLFIKVLERFNLPSNFSDDPTFNIFSELGVIFLLFMIGLETNINDMLKVGTKALFVACLGVILPFVLSYYSIPLLFPDISFAAKLVMGATLCATSIGITAAILAESHQVTTKLGQIIIGAAVIDDVLGLIILAVVGGIIQYGTFEVHSFGMILLKTFLFFVISFGIGKFLLPRFTSKIHENSHQSLLLGLGILLCFSYALFAAEMGLAPIIGAFSAGLLLDNVEIIKGPNKKVGLEDVFQPLQDLFLPVFFVVTGMRVNLSSLMGGEGLMLILIVSVCAILGKILSGYVINKKEADPLAIGLGMVPRGEVGLIFASFGLSSKAIDIEFYSTLVAVVIITTLIAPIFLAARLKHLEAKK